MKTSYKLSQGFCFTSILVLSLTMALLNANAQASTNPVESPLDFRMKTLDGMEADLSQYKGKVMLFVNVASKCGLTPQYTALQVVYEKYQDQGFVILGFPANNFGSQEPGTNTEIQQFCTVNYGVSFPMFAKISVKGSDKHPLYAFFTESKTNPDFSGEIQWNFTKFLIGRDGSVVNRFEPKIVPDSPEVIAAIEKALRKEELSESEQTLVPGRTQFCP